MREHLDNAWKEFERTGEICNSAEQLLNLAGDLTEQVKLLREALNAIVDEAGDSFTICEDCNYQGPSDCSDVLLIAQKALEATK